MSILIDAQTRIIVQGITGRDGSFHTKGMLDYGSTVVGGVTPGKGGQEVEGLPVFDTVDEAVSATGATCSVCFVPARFADSAIKEAAGSSIALFVCITEGVPVLDMVENLQLIQRTGKRMIGPNCPGLISPGSCKVGIMPAHIHLPGSIGVISRSGTLTYEVVQSLTDQGLGQSTVVGIGGDPVIGTHFADVLRRFELDPMTDHVVLIGEIGGSEEERAAQFVASEMTKPVTAFVAGRTAPAGKRMGHAGAIIEGGEGTAQDKIAALEAAGVPVARHPAEVAELVARRL